MARARGTTAWFVGLALACAPEASLARCPAPQAGKEPREPGGLDEFVESRPYSIPDKQGARVLYDGARSHVDAGRWTEAVTAIERLIAEHSASVIALPLAGEPPPRSVQTVYRGAAAAARELFERLPDAARAACAERYAAEAEGLLARAVVALDTTALAELARRFPLTAAASRAWLVLGDLEAEAGNFEAARVAWERARGDIGAPDFPAAAFEGALEARRGWHPGDGALRSARARSFSLADAAAETEALPASDAHAWEDPVRLDDDAQGPLLLTSRSDYFNSFPLVAGGTVFASNSLALLAADALTGRVRWRSPEHPGWAVVRSGAYTARNGTPVSFSQFFQGLDREGLMLAPAAGSGVVVAALQVPFTPNGSTQFQQQIQIETVIPDRRLFAYDAESGRPLWNHAPPPLWDCDSGSFTTRMRVAAPPVIAGSRILVPMWRPQGRIAYHVACFDLYSGALLWSTPVASGQRPLNMFGRMEREFCAPPLVVAGAQVIALTQLGALAALDLFSGEILWETVYDQVALPAADGMQAAPRRMHWRNAPPAIANGVIVATPLDSPDMLGVDLASGSVLWTLGASSIGRPRGRFNEPWCLLGVLDDTVYLGGRYVIARRARNGLADDRGPTEESVSESLYGDGHSDASRLPRAILTARHVIVPTRDRRIALDRRNVELEDPRSSGSFGAPPAGFGNLALGGGSLVALSSQELCGVLDWSSIETRLAEDVARAPQDGAHAARLGDFLRERAASELSEARPQAALEYLARAHQVLAPALAAGAPEARRAEFEALRLEARVLTLNAQASLSLERLERAVQLAPDRPGLALVLAEIARVAQGRSAVRFESALAELDEQCGDLEFQVEPDAPWLGARDVRRWVIEQRIADAANRGDTGREFAALVDLLDRRGDDPLTEGELAGETPSRRIARRLAAGPRERAAWQPFEARARAALDSARAAGDGRALDRVLLLYPHTQAARDARDARLRLALESRDAPTAVRTVFSELSADWNARNSTPREAQILWLAARALALDGNPLYADAVLRRLARSLPDVPADVEAPATTFAMLADALEEAAGAGEPLHAAALPTFDAPSREVFQQNGECVLLGRLDTGSRVVSVLAARDRLDALVPDGTRLWSRPVEGATAALSWLANARLVQGTAPRADSPPFSGRILLTWRRGVLAIDGATGADAWSWSSTGSVDTALACDSGVVVVSAVPEGGRRVLVGLDVARGTELWRRDVEAGEWPQPIVGSGLAVLLPRPTAGRRSTDGGDGAHEAVAIELVAGTTLRAVDIGTAATSEDRAAAWIEDERLVVPRFGRVRGPEDAVAAFDLETGARVWRVPVDGERRLDSIVRHGHEAYLVYLVQGPGSAEGGIVELDTRLGATRPVPGVELGVDDLPIGLRSDVVTRLDAPFLFVRSAAPGGRETLIRAVHLPYGQRWAFRLPVSPAALYPQSFPLPAVTSRLVVLAYTEELRPAAGRSQWNTHLVSIDRESGAQRERRVLPHEAGRSESLELATLERLLIVCGKGRVLALAQDNGEEQR